MEYFVQEGSRIFSFPLFSFCLSGFLFSDPSLLSLTYYSFSSLSTLSLMSYLHLLCLCRCLWLWPNPALVVLLVLLGPRPISPIAPHTPHSESQRPYNVLQDCVPAAFLVFLWLDLLFSPPNLLLSCHTKLLSIPPIGYLLSCHMAFALTIPSA